MVALWFISDTHFRHTNTWALFKDACGNPLRPFSSTEEMDDCMIQRWNEVVRPQDHVYHLGDVSMLRPRFVARQLKALNGHKRLIRGNHDIYKTKEYLEFFEEIHGVRVMDNILFSHIPVHPACLGRFAANVHGHLHSGVVTRPAGPRMDCGVPTWPPMTAVEPDTRYVNIVVEQTDYRPVSFEELKARITLLKESS